MLKPHFHSTLSIAVLALIAGCRGEISQDSHASSPSSVAAALSNESSEPPQVRQPAMDARANDSVQLGDSADTSGDLSMDAQVEHQDLSEESAEPSHDVGPPSNVHDESESSSTVDQASFFSPRNMKWSMALAKARLTPSYRRAKEHYDNELSSFHDRNWRSSRGTGLPEGYVDFERSLRLKAWNDLIDITLSVMDENARNELANNGYIQKKRSDIPSSLPPVVDRKNPSGANSLIIDGRGDPYRYHREIEEQLKQFREGRTR